MIFKDRAQAATLLATALRPWAGAAPLILAIPRGGVPMGHIVAAALGGELDVVLVRKIGAPLEPEVAVGAIDESGHAYIADYAPALGADSAYLADEIRRQEAVLAQRRRQYTPIRPPIDPAGRVVIIVDDGLATGATMIAACQAIRARRPQRLICAVPVASTEAAAKVRPQCDQLVCLQQPAGFQAVGQFYTHFPQVEDAEVIATLARPLSAS